MADNIVGIVDALEKRCLQLFVRWLSLAGRNHRLGLLLDQVVNEREVVRRKVPNDVHIVLKQAKINASGVVGRDLNVRVFRPR